MIEKVRSFLQFILLAALAIIAAPLAAHSTPNSEVRLSVLDETVIADIIVPRGEYAFGTGNPVDSSDHSLRAAREYLLNHIDVATPSGQRWQVSISSVEFVQIDGPPDLHAVAELVPPGGASPLDLTMEWRVLIDTLPGHFALFLLDDGPGGGERTIIGAVRNGSPPLNITLAREGALEPLTSAIGLGAHHIIEGYDHLLFLLVLLLPAPLVARSGRWAGHRPTGATLIKLAKIVTAFTIGHSLTLIAATVWQWSLPTAPVEIAIAVSVLISAMHAVRPLLPGKEPLVALIFGLVHGLAFATLVQEAHAGMVSGALTLLGFNLGIELVQLAIVAAVVPSLLVLSRHSFYNGLRQALAYLSAAAAMAWIVNRTTGQAEGVVASMETAMSHMAWLIPVAALLALGLIAQSLIRDGYGARSVRT
ncbi:HupE/UreJ family protein [Qipengyuania qiaonensis]|uniref:HupE/UreJ family protein n=1 Tax=Qipengyuania qiaonensis TaxID=2867240 RepID=A0ABS7J808_9SPHN|nr:HupE/UreJ family protein [Qipengyuania qiaonensis]MBX7483459.1 HupE/UreJ family protein [Qipengyuania qiaonensis]